MLVYLHTGQRCILTSLEMEPLINEMLLPPTLRGLVEEVREQLASLQLVVAPPVLNIITAAVRVTSCVYIFSQKVGNNVGHQNSPAWTKENGFRIEVPRPGTSVNDPTPPLHQCTHQTRF